MKNTTLGRKASNDMKKGVGMVKPRTAADQRGDGADFAFNGQMGDGVNRSAETHRFAGNQYSTTMKENFGMGPRVGNKSSAADDVGPSATKDPKKLTIATASQGGVTGRRSVEFPRNPDAINVGNK